MDKEALSIVSGGPALYRKFGFRIELTDGVWRKICNRLRTIIILSSLTLCGIDRLKVNAFANKNIAPWCILLCSPVN